MDAIAARDGAGAITTTEDGVAWGGWRCGQPETDAFLMNAETPQFVQIDLRYPTVVCGVATQSHAYKDEWVTHYRVRYSDDGEVWRDYCEAADQAKGFTVLKGNDEHSLEQKSAVKTHSLPWSPKISSIQRHGTSEKRDALEPQQGRRARR